MKMYTLKISYNVKIVQFVNKSKQALQKLNKYLE